MIARGLEWDTVAEVASNLPQEVPPDLIELTVRLQAGSRRDLPELADASLVGQEVFWNRFALADEQTPADTALCWEVIKA